MSLFRCKISVLLLKYGFQVLFTPLMIIHMVSLADPQHAGKKPNETVNHSRLKV